MGKYPIGSKDSDINNLLDGLARLVQDGIAAIPDDTSIEIIESKLSGEPVPERLVNFCNAEISKALTSQTLATEQKMAAHVLPAKLMQNVQATTNAQTGRL
nr:DUF935 family protein [Ningiella sp. W23]